MSKLVGIDFGKARIGLAISDERKIIAFPLTTIRAEKTLEESAKKVMEFLTSYSVEKIVMGLPLLLNGKEGEMAQLARQFAALLSLPCIFWDERLTSAQIEKSLKEMELSRKKRSQLSDTLAATLILQNYLDSIYVASS